MGEGNVLQTSARNNTCTCLFGTALSNSPEWLDCEVIEVCAQWQIDFYGHDRYVKILKAGTYFAQHLYTRTDHLRPRRRRRLAHQPLEEHLRAIKSSYNK